MPESPLSDEAIVQRVRAGEVALFELLMRRHNQRIYRAVRGLIRDEAEIEDVMQQAYVAAFFGLDGFLGEARFSTWLVRIAINEALMRARRRGRLVAVGDPFGGDDDGGAEVISLATAEGNGPERRTGARELVALLESVVDELPEGARTVFLLREVEGMSTAEAAECLGTSEAALKVRLHRAKAQIKDALAERLGEGAADAFRFEAPRCDRIVEAVLEKIRSDRPE
jgi:RNA polymerase sigma-70 factor (ECF subfamily)